MLAGLAAHAPAPRAALPKPRHKTKQANALDFDPRPLLHHIAGTDLTQIHGIGPYLALRLVSECGTDLSRWPRPGNNRACAARLQGRAGARSTPRTVDSLHRRRADFMAEQFIVDHVALHWLEWNGGAPRLTDAAANACQQLGAIGLT